jgi:hypothetical protein
MPGWDDFEFTLQTEAAGQLVPPGRRPPTAIATAAAPLPPPKPHRRRSQHRTRSSRVGLFARSILRAGFDLADAIAAGLRA